MSETKFMLLMHPDTRDCYNVSDKEFVTIDEAVRYAMSFGTDDFWIITKHEWKAVEKEEENNNG